MVSGRKKVLSYRWAAMIGLLLLQVATGAALAQAPSVTINPEGTVSGGNATVSGTVVSPTPPPGGQCYINGLYVQVAQFVRGQVVNQGNGYFPLSAGYNGTWTVTVSGYAAAFKPGPAQVNAQFYYSCYDSSGNFVSQGTVQTGASLRLTRVR
jgi:hypothetical protein